MTKETIIKSTLKYLVKRQIAEGSVGFAVDNDHDHDCCWDDVLAWIEAQSCEEDFVKHKKEVLERIAKREREIDKYIKELEALEQQPKPMEKFDDVKTHIQRLAGDYKCWDNRLTWEEALELNRMLEAQPSEDCISREEVQDLISRWLSDCLLDETREALEIINYKVGDMPSVTPERPKGKWIRVVDKAGHWVWECDCKWQQRFATNYCPNCGADMSGGEEDET